MRTSAFDEKCVRLIHAYSDRRREYAERRRQKRRAANNELGFIGASELAKRAIWTEKSIDEAIKE